MATSLTSAFSPETIRQHGLTPDEYEKIKQLLGGREPTLTELGIFSVMWSEHCSYKSSRVHLKRLPTRSKRVLQGPGENAGIIDIGDGWACAFKIESHNHPSFIEPFQGATTGVGGILRDIFTMGARPVAVMDSLRFGPIRNKISVERALLPATAGSIAEEAGKSARSTQPHSTQTPSTQAEIHRNHSILEGVVSGVASYGNCFGVPNLGGETKFEPCYSGNPLVNAFALGLVRKNEIFYARAAGEGNPVIYVGAKTGRDGIHGATMASEEFSEASEAKRPNVQVGDPFLEKLLLEACLEAMQTGAIVGIQDMGAAGLTCSTCEMGGRGGVGIEIELDRVPQRETGMTPYEIMLSESQERMLLVAEKGREQEVFRVFEKWGLDAVEVGKVTSDNKLRVLEHGKVVAEIPNPALTDEAPLYKRPLSRWEPPVPREKPDGVQLGAAPQGLKPESFSADNGTAEAVPFPSSLQHSVSGDFTPALKQLLASSNVCGKRWVWQQYDHMVQTNTVESPGAGDAGVIRIKGSNRGLSMALDGNGRWCYLDPRLGAMHAVAEAARKVACSGATPVAATNCLNFGNPEKPHIMWQFSQTIDGITKACEELEIPITGGNVSFYNETLGEGIYPTPVLGVVGILEDVHKAAKMHFAAAGRTIVLLRTGEAADITDAESEFGSSEYAKEILGTLWGYPPELDLEKEGELQKAVVEMIQQQLLDSAHDCSDGGIAVALAEKAFAKGVGARVNLASGGLFAEFVLFGEDASRIVISCDPASVARIKEVAGTYDVAADVIGETTPDNLEISLDGKIAVSSTVGDLSAVYESALQSALRTDPELVSANGSSLEPKAKGPMLISDKFHDECGVVAIFAHPEAEKLAYLGLHALQHRGQESAGIVTSDGLTSRAHKAMGSVADIFTEDVLSKLRGSIAIGHTRYSTAGDSALLNAQPILVQSNKGAIAVAHNGNLINAVPLRARLESQGSIFQTNSDTEVIVHLIALSKEHTLPEAMADALRRVDGAFSLVMMSNDRIFAVRDPRGFRPLAMGRIAALEGQKRDTVVFASETCAFDLIGADYVRDVKPGELIVVGPEGMSSRFYSTAAPQSSCIFEHVYFSRPDSLVFGRPVQTSREELGRQLAREAGVDADLVVPVPDSGVTAAVGYASESEIPFRFALIRNHYVGRTFIEPSQSVRDFGVKLKLNPVRSLLEGKRVVLIDDSIVRGTTSRKIVRMIRNAGATEVHMRISCPPTISPCYYGVDTPSKKQLIAANKSVDEIRDYIGADSLAYLSLEGLKKACGEGPQISYCSACYTGKYPTDVVDVEEILPAAVRR